MHQSILSSHVHPYEPMGIRRALPSSGAAVNKYQIISSADVSVNEAMSRFSGSYTAVANGGLCQPIVCPDQSTSIYGSVVSFEYQLAMSKTGSMSPPLVFGIYWEQANATPPASVDASSVLAYFPLSGSIACMTGSDGAATPVTTSRYVFTNKDKVTIPPVTDGKVGFFGIAVEFNESGAQAVVGMLSMRRYVNYTGYFDPLK